MTFLNWFMLAGLAGLAVPIIIHLLNRSRARVVDWGAMRFIEASLASRSRRILIEEILLLVLRCLIIALAAFALARPFLPSRPTAMVVLFAPALLAAAICAALAAAMWANRRARRWLLAATVALLAVPPAAGAIEQAYQGRLWSFGGGRKDVAIVIDGSTSMALKRDGNTNFARAVREARAVLAGCGPGDGVSLVLAGPSPAAVLPAVTSDKDKAAAALAGLEPSGGSMRAVPAIQAACESLLTGANPVKKIVVITDGQRTGWG
ncbi:MAG: BatA domain-containing protein, partial [Planctomycetes bacterium]|nr:BatA domain-containing protein [Planctomycetota bacterium]